MGSWLSCKEYTQRASQRIDAEIPWSEKPGYWFHHLLCASCRRFQQHILFIEKVLRALRSSNRDLDVIDDRPEAALSKEAALRLQRALEQRPEN